MRSSALAALFVLACLPLHASAQTDATLLLLEPVGVPDPAIAQQLTIALGDAARALGYHVVTPAPGSAVGALDPGAGADLLSVAQRTGVHRALAVWVVPASAGYAVQVGLATEDGTVGSLRASTSASAITDTATRLTSSLLPAPFAAASVAWGTAAVLAPVAPAPVAVAPVAVASTYAPPPPAATAPARGSRGEMGFVIGGTVSLVLGYVLELVIGLFGGYHDRVCWIGPCSGGTSWDPAWDGFRASSLVPIAGPWIQLAVKPPSEHDAWVEFLVIDGILQGAGAILLFVGIGLAESGSEAPPAVTVLPWIGPGLAGALVGGRF